MNSAEALDLSRLPPFTLVDADYEPILASRKASLLARFAEAGIPYDVENLETDSAIILQEEDAHREMLDKQALNFAGARLTVAYGWGAALDHIAATYYADIGVRRMPLVDEPRPFATDPEDWEDDDRFRRRINLASEARSPYTPGAYVYAALSASMQVSDAVALNWASGIGLAPGEIRVVVLGIANADEPALLQIVATAIANRPIKALTDVVTIAAAKRVTVPFTAVLRVRRGPDPAVVRAEAMRKLAIYCAERRRVGVVMAGSGLDGALHVGGVEQVDSGFSTIDPGPDAIVELAPLSVTTEVAGG